MYGHYEIEPIAQELLALPELQRLDGISQMGYLPQARKEQDYTRLEHSLGVYALECLIADTQEARISGLLHDVSHTAFSHCTEYAVEREDVTSMTMQDDMHPDYIRSSGIPDILEQHGIDTDRIIHEANFPLLERNLPDLCSDRIDYCLRGGYYAGYVSSTGIKELLGGFNSNFYLKQNQWVFNSPAAAMEFASLFKVQNDNEWSGIDTAAMFYGTGMFLQRAFELELTDHSQLHRTDNELLADITPHITEDEQLTRYWAIMNRELTAYIDESTYEVELPVKSRAVNPLVLHKNIVRRLSEVPGYTYWADILKYDMQPKIYRLFFA